MQQKHPDRRALLQGAGALFTGATMALAAKPAFSLQIQELDPQNPLAQSYTAGCRKTVDHQDIIARLEAELGLEPARALSATCPSCGCRVTARRL
ncbi:MAG: hypothetical protein KIS73_04735 [Enhydrobacter sp.]|nr:hypothetical protein [Enhydrobacter sp.]